MSTGRTAELKRVWPQGKAKRREQNHGFMPKESQAPYIPRPPHQLVTVWARSWHENGMTLLGHLASRRAERGEGHCVYCQSFVT